VNKIKTQRYAKGYRNLKIRPVSTTEVLSQRVPIRTHQNILYSHGAKGIRDIARIDWQPWEQKIAEMMRLLESQRFQRANRYYSALERVQSLLGTVRQRERELQSTVEELQATTEELQATTEELERTGSYLQTLMNSQVDVLMTVDANGVITDINQATERLSGYGREELVGQPFRRFFTDPARAQAGVEQVLGEGTVSDYELVVRTKDGEEVPVSYNATVQRDPEGQITGVVGNARDITERLQAEEKLHQAIQYTRNLIETILDPLVTVDSEGRITDLNQATELATGYSREELIGTEFADHFSEPEQARAGYQQVFREDFVRDYLLELRHRDGHFMPVLFNAAVYRDEQGEIIGLIAVARDITKHKEIEEKLFRSNAELEQFAYVASHDLQEPLRKIESFGNLLQKEAGEELGEQGNQYLEWMQEAVGRMRTLINDLLTFSRVTKQKESFVPVDLAEVAANVVSDLEVRLEETGGRVEVGELPTLKGDSTQMRQLLQNLIGNALKFRREEEAPRVKVYSRRLEEQEPRPNGFAPDEEVWEIRVEDNGIGFEEKYLDQIFIPFQGLHGRQEYEGSGIGLAVCRKIVEHYGGHITARSTPGQGSTFIVTLPAHPS